MGLAGCRARSSRFPSVIVFRPCPSSLLLSVPCVGSVVKGGIDSLDITYTRWKGMLDSVNTAEDSTFQQLNSGAKLAEFPAASSAVVSPACDRCSVGRSDLQSHTMFL